MINLVLLIVLLFLEEMTWEIKYIAMKMDLYLYKRIMELEYV